MCYYILTQNLRKGCINIVAIKLIYFHVRNLVSEISKNIKCIADFNLFGFNLEILTAFLCNSFILTFSTKSNGTIEKPFKHHA